MTSPVVIGNATLYHAEALSVLGTLPDESVDAVFTDPPYSSGGMFRGDRMASTHSKYTNSDSVSGHAIAGFSGDNRDQMAYLFWVGTWVAELRRIAKPGAICGLFTDWRQLPTTSIALQMGGFVWRGIFVWNKPMARPMLGRFTNACEYVVWGTNGPREIEGDALPGFYTCNPPPTKDREHITQKPVDVMRVLLRSAPSNAVVLDPVHGQRINRGCMRELRSKVRRRRNRSGTLRHRLRAHRPSPTPTNDFRAGCAARESPTLRGHRCQSAILIGATVAAVGWRIAGRTSVAKRACS